MMDFVDEGRWPTNGTQPNYDDYSVSAIDLDTSRIKWMIDHTDQHKKGKKRYQMFKITIETLSGTYFRVPTHCRNMLTGTKLDFTEE